MQGTNWFRTPGRTNTVGVRYFYLPPQKRERNEMSGSHSTSEEQVEQFLKAQDEATAFIPVEYKVIDMNPLLVGSARSRASKLEDAFNELGKDGWDLVSWQDGRAIFSRC